MNPNDLITRQEVFVILARALKLQSEATVKTSFSDVNEISDWAKGEVYALANAGYVKGSNGKLNHRGLITRAEFAQVMSNIISQYISVAGTYTAAAAGSIMINVPGVTLKDLTVTGDLIIGDGVGGGFEANGIYLWKSAGNTVTYNTISGNAVGHGMEMFGSKENTITENTITDNQDGMYIRNINETNYPGYSIKDNYIYHNRIHDNTHLNLYCNAAYPFNIKYNWWGSADENEIKAKLAGWTDTGAITPGVGLDFLEYTPWAEGDTFPPA